MAGYLTLTLVLWASLAAQAQACGLASADLLLKSTGGVPVRLALGSPDSGAAPALTVVRLVPLAGKLVVLTGVETPALRSQPAIQASQLELCSPTAAPVERLRPDACLSAVPSRAP